MMTKLLKSVLFLIPSNSMGLKSALTAGTNISQGCNAVRPTPDPGHENGDTFLCRHFVLQIQQVLYLHWSRVHRSVPKLPDLQMKLRTNNQPRGLSSWAALRLRDTKVFADLTHQVVIYFGMTWNRAALI